MAPKKEEIRLHNPKDHGVFSNFHNRHFDDHDALVAYNKKHFAARAKAKAAVEPADTKEKATADKTPAANKTPAAAGKNGGS